MIINDLDGYYIVFDTKNWNTELDTLLDNLLDLVRFTDEVDILTAAGNEYWKGGTHTFMPCYEYLVKSCIVRKCLIEPSELKSFTDNFEITNSVERTDLYLHTLENINSPL